MRATSDKRCRRTQNTRFISVNIFFFENRAVCDVMWKNIVERSRPQMTAWRMRIACWIPKATNTLRILQLINKTVKHNNVFLRPY